MTEKAASNTTAGTREKTSLTLKLSDYDAFIFDLDGVITQTAHLHAASWKTMFDDFLKNHNLQTGQEQPPFQLPDDYTRFVDGKPRYEGVQSFLESRNISLDWGSADDSPAEETICGLGNRKNRLYQQALKEEGAKVFDTSVAFLKTLKQHGKPIGLFTSSKNCHLILQMTGLDTLFDATVDGNDLTRLQLRGKPKPDMLLETARQLHANVNRTVIFEDALAGVEPGKAGHFGLVVGISRKQDSKLLKAHGADAVIDDLSEILLETER